MKTIWNFSIADGSTYFRKCAHSLPGSECFLKLFFTNYEKRKLSQQINNDKRLNFRLTYDYDPSFVIESKPRIDNTEYVTYIFGALGSWVGFPFILINPVPYLMRINEDSSSIETESEMFKRLKSSVIKIVDKNIRNRLRNLITKSIDKKAKTKVFYRRPRSALN